MILQPLIKEDKVIDNILIPTYTISDNLKKNFKTGFDIAEALQFQIEL